MQKFLDVLGRWEAGSLSQLEAAELVGCSERQFRRWRDRYEEEGEAGLKDRRLGRVSGRAIAGEERERMLALYRTRHRGWTAKHFHDWGVRHHGFRWGYTWTKTQLHGAGLLVRAARRGAHRRKRERKPCEGMMLHQDGSRHAWLSGEAPLDLIVTMDDATSRIYSAFLVEEEGTASTFRALLEVLSEHGLPCSLYTDRGSHYFVTPEAGGKVDKVHLTQVGRALSRLGVEHIAAYSPEARGRSERMFGTLQDRLVKELAEAGIGDVAAANAWIRDVYLPEHNRLFAKPAALPERAFVAATRSVLVETLASEEERVVARDNTVSYGGLKLQIPASPVRAHYVKAKVRVREYPDGALAILAGPRVIGRYDSGGEPLRAAPSVMSGAVCSSPSRRGLDASVPASGAPCRPASTGSARPARPERRAGAERRAAQPSQETGPGPALPPT